MGKSSGSKAEVVEYTMSIHVGVGHELDAVTEIRIDEKVAWRGNVTTNIAIGINNPNLFGGQRKEGGLVGTVQVLMGREDQVLPAAAAARYRLAPNDCPAFRGITTLMFHGSGTVSTGRLGEWDNALAGLVNIPGFPVGQPAYSGSGFLWKMNSPVIAQKIEVTGVRAPKGLDPATAMVGPDANPIHIIYECLVNDEWGMAGAAALIDKAGFEVEAVRLRDEGFGISLWWMRQQTIEAFVTEILDHIQATIFVNPNTGLLSVKLLRDDYDIATLRHITPDNATLSNFKRRSSGEIVNEMTVSFTSPITEKAESITAQDIASIESQDGQKVAGSRDYYGIRNRELAGKVLARDLRASTAPLISAEAKLDRSGWDVLPGEVMLLSWPRRNTNAVVVRAGKVSYGKPKDSAIRVSLMQDVFSLSKPAITIMPSTGWEDPTVDPQPLNMRLFTVPAFFARNAEMQGEVVALGPNEALVGALADSETYDSYDYELVSESVTANGDTVITSKGGKSMTPLALLASPMASATTSVIPFALFPIAEETPRVGGFVFIGESDTTQEIALVTGRTSTGWTVSRGVLDTVPRLWAAGTPLWLVNPGARIVDNQTIYAEGETAVYRGLDRTARGLLGYEDAPSISTVVTDRAHLPLRPANVQLNGVSFGPVAAGAASLFTLSWAIRNRLAEDSQVLLWTDGSVQPEYRQETVVRVYDAGTGTLLKTYDGIWTDTTIQFARWNLDRYTSLRFEVMSRRDGDWSLTGHSITLTGLPGNPASPGLPENPDRTNPPSFYPMPALSAFAASAVAVIGSDGSETPAIEVVGTPDRLEPKQLVVQYRRLLPIDEVTGERPVDELGQPVTLPWVTAPAVPLSGDEVRFQIASVAADTEYDVAVAYVVDGLIGQFRWLGVITTGSRTVPEVDTTPPAEVAGLTLSSTSTPDAAGNPYVRIIATWTANTEEDLNGYEVEITEGSVTVVDYVATNQHSREALTGRTYTFRVRAIDKAGNRSAWSPPQDIVGAGDTTPPGPPTTLEATASVGSIFLRWTNPGASDLAKVEVWENTTNNSGTATKIAVVVGQSSGAGSYSRSGLPSGVTRYYWLKAVDTSGNASGFSTGISAATASIQVTDFASSLTPPLLAANDAAATALIPGGNTLGKLYLNTTNRKLYRGTGSGWTAETDGADITADSITAGQIAAGAISTTELAAGAVTAGKIGAGQVTTTELAAGAVNADKIQAGSITGDRISTSTSLPGTITVGSTGVSIGTIQSQADDPAARVNANSTLITPGRVQIQGGTSLDNWRDGTDINGGSIKTNSIQARSLVLAMRNVQSINNTFRAYPDTNVVGWTGGGIVYQNDSGTTTGVGLSSGSVTYAGTTIFIYWSSGASSLSTTTSQAVANGPNNVIMATYNGGALLTVYNGRTLITPEGIVTPSLSAITANIGDVTAGLLRNGAGTTFFDLNNARSQYRRGAYDLRIGTIGTGVTLWYGPTSITIGSETRTNGVWSFGDDGKVYYGSTELGGSAPFKVTSTHRSIGKTRSGAGIATTDLVTFGVQGATGPVSFDVYFVDGDDTVTATNTSTDDATSPFEHQTSFRATLAVGQQKTARFVCAVRDAAGNSGAAYVAAGLTETT